MNDAQLKKLTLKELRALNADIEQAIRAAIRAKNGAKASMPMAANAAPVKIDLERERDAWLSAKR